MLRISESETGNGHVLLKLEGRVIGPWVSELQRASGRILDASRILKLDLADVSYIDRDGVRLLLALQREGVVFQSASPFVLEELREASTAKS